MQLAVRFWSKVAQTGNVCECWDWTAGTNVYGYGRFGHSKKQWMAHRIAWELTNGPVPIGLDLDHLCRNRTYVNPWHLEPVTRGENVRRGISGELSRVRQKAKTHCPRGHEYAGTNLYEAKKTDGSINRMCRACMKARHAAKYAASKIGVN